MQAEVATAQEGQSGRARTPRSILTIAKLPGVFTTAEQWKSQAIIIDPQAARRQDRRMAQVVRREHHELKAGAFRRLPSSPAPARHIPLA